MIKPAIFIDAYITDEQKKKWFNYNLSNYIKTDWDVFVMSNKMPSFDKFSDIKYFEYDSTNRILNDPSKYKLNSKIQWFNQLHDGIRPLYFRGYSYTHGFTNWTILCNMKKICKVLKRFGHQYMIRCDYDVVFKDYQLMENIFKTFGTTEKSKNGIFVPDLFGSLATFYLLNVDYVDSKLPELETEEDYSKFMYQLYGNNTSPVFEHLLFDIFGKDCEFIDRDECFKNVENVGICVSSGGDFGLRHKIIYKNLMMTPVNDNKDFFIYNSSSSHTIYVELKTYRNESYVVDTFGVPPLRWFSFSCSKQVEIKTSDMPENYCVTFDLSEPCTFTLTPN